MAAMTQPMSPRSRHIRSRISGMSRLPNANERELAWLRSEFAASRLEDHIREVAPTLDFAQITRLVAVLLDDEDQDTDERMST